MPFLLLEEGQILLPGSAPLLPATSRRNAGSPSAALLSGWEPHSPLLFTFKALKRQFACFTTEKQKKRQFTNRPEGEPTLWFFV